MKYAIIAAGEGSRLAQEGIRQPKPLVEVGGECLIDRLMRIFAENGATEINIICNDRMPEVARHLEQVSLTHMLSHSHRFHYVIKSTPSSMHSLWQLSPWLQDESFVLTTVDTIFHEDDFSRYVTAFRQLVDSGEADGLMGVTGYIDDEKPLYVGVERACIPALASKRSSIGMMGDDGYPEIRGFYDSLAELKSDIRHPTPNTFISGGIYGLTPPCLDTLRRCVERGESRMRNFQRALVTDGLRLKAWPFSIVLDIDHADDIRKAETFLKN